MSLLLSAYPDVGGTILHPPLHTKISPPVPPRVPPPVSARLPTVPVRELLPAPATCPRPLMSLKLRPTLAYVKSLPRLMSLKVTPVSLYVRWQPQLQEKSLCNRNSALPGFSRTGTLFEELIIPPPPLFQSEPLPIPAPPPFQSPTSVEAETQIAPKVLPLPRPCDASTQTSRPIFLVPRPQLCDTSTQTTTLPVPRLPTPAPVSTVQLELEQTVFHRPDPNPIVPLDQPLKPVHPDTVPWPDMSNNDVEHDRPIVRASGDDKECHLCAVTFKSYGEDSEHFQSAVHQRQKSRQRTWLHHCEMCDRTCSGLESFVTHISGKKHRRQARLDRLV